MQRIESGTLVPASLLVQRFSGLRCQEKPSSKAFRAKMGREEGAQYCYSRSASPGALLPRSSHDGPLIHRTSPSSTSTWHMGSAAVKEALASSIACYGQPGPHGPTGATQSSSCPNRGTPTAPYSPSPKAKYCPQWLRALVLGSGPSPRGREASSSLAPS